MSAPAFSTKKDRSEENFKAKLKQKEKEMHEKLPEWKKRDESIRKRYGEWQPTHKLSRQQIQDIRNIKEKIPGMKTVELATHFKVSPEAIRRILQSNWVPNDSEEERMRLRGEKNKHESQVHKQSMINDVELARKRLSYGKSISLGLAGLATGHKGRSLKKSFTTDGKVNFDSTNSHGYYNRKQRSKTFKRKSYVDNVGDIID